MITLQALTEQQVRAYLNVTPEQFEYLRHPSPDHLHDPFYYKDMRELVMALHRFKQKQKNDLSLLLMVDGDYDADGIYSAVILAASLSVFGFRFRVHIPTMAEGYGLSVETIQRMKREQERDGSKIGMILTADQGVNAFMAIDYAKSQGIQVLVTDHHPGGKRSPKAGAIVDPNRPDDLYPFKGNSGACVAWKAMLAYADLFAKEQKPLIERLIVFAGLSNVADVMPILDENRYTVTAALAIVRELLSHRIASEDGYRALADTPYPEYNTPFYALYDLITLLQESKDVKRAKDGKKPVPLPVNEELFGWYLAPMLNAPRRVHDTCLEGLCPFLIADTKTRHHFIRRLIDLNEEKSRLRDRVMDALPKKDIPPVLCVNTRKGIAGLIAGKVSEQTGLPSIVFGYDAPDTEQVIYDTAPNVRRLSGSARSNPACPINRVLAKVEQRYPGLVTGGGHAEAAGCSIESRHLDLFRKAVAEAIPEVTNEVLEEAEVTQVPSNRIWIVATEPETLMALYEKIEDRGNEQEVTTERDYLNPKTFRADILETIRFFEGLRPFGKGFEAETEFYLVFDKTVLQYDWNPDFWKTFKFRLFNAEVLTFDEKWAKLVKEELPKGTPIIARARLQRNEFRGKVTPQLILSQEQ